MDRANKAPLLFSTPAQRAATRAALRGGMDVPEANGGDGIQGRVVSEFAELVDGK